ncbi:MAG: diguanylate cyclase [Labilithrix sp.]|nr:diguanylate cyclase [Labilithrix sp.]MCW5816895.1 diguanylate cyclase [Labilithrix sp.]
MGVDLDDDEPSSERESTVLRAALAPAVAGLSAPSLDTTPTACVLVADDDAPTRELIASTLRASGYEVETVADGQAAVERVARGGIDVVLLDAVMPRMSGFDACRTIRGLGGHAAGKSSFVPVALVFAKTDPKSRIEAVKIGADGYVCKPFEQTELLVCVSSALKIKRAHDRLASMRERLDRLRRFDPLTEAYSFLHLNERLDAEFTRAERHSEPLACAVLDVDRLKIHNERGGRSLGDAVLCGVAEVIKGSVRDSDAVARYGGDEFFVLLPSTHFAGSLVVASRIWRDVAARVFTSSSPDGPREARVTASLGVALFPSRDVRTKEALLGALEAALLEAKRRGGNRLCVFQQEGFIYTPSGDERG